MHGPSHGGSSSFSGGGFSGGGSSNFSSGVSSGGSRGSRSSTFIFFGHPFTFGGPWIGLAGFFLIALIGAIIVTVISAVGFCDQQKQLNYMKDDAVEYQRIIANANLELLDDNYFLYTISGIHFRPDSGISPDGYTFEGYSYSSGDTAIVANYCFTYEDLDYYQLIYAFYDENNDTQVTGLTYAYIKENQIANFRTVEIAYTLVSANETYSINSDYDLKTCPEYLYLKSETSSQRTAAIVAGLIAGVMIAVIVVLIVTSLKKGKKMQALKEEKARAEIDKSKAETDLVREDIKKSNRKCAYCGASIPKDADVCPGCGSRITE